MRAELPNPDYVLLPGQFTRVKLLLDVRQNAITVPVKSLVIEKGGAYVYVVRPNNKVEKRFIELGPEIGNNVVVERGLATGERVVIEGYHKLSPGMEVRVVEVAPDNDDAMTVVTESVDTVVNADAVSN